MTVEDEVRAEAAEADAVLIGNDAELIANCWTDDWVAVDATGVTSKPTSSAGSRRAGCSITA
jgi:ketosteroid isomerase-like protein